MRRQLLHIALSIAVISFMHSAIAQEFEGDIAKRLDYDEGTIYMVSAVTNKIMLETPGFYGVSKKTTYIIGAYTEIYDEVDEIRLRISLTELIEGDYVEIAYIEDLYGIKYAMEITYLPEEQ